MTRAGANRVLHSHWLRQGMTPLLALCTLAAQGCSGGADFSSGKGAATTLAPLPSVTPKEGDAAGQDPSVNDDQTGNNSDPDIPEIDDKKDGADGGGEKGTGPKDDDSSEDSEDDSNGIVEELEPKGLRSVQRRFDLSGDVVSQTLLQRNIEESVEWTLSQPQRPAGSIERLQGIGQKPMVQSFAQDDLGLLDILVVVDNSRSMKQEQAELGSRLSDLLTSVSDSNWKIGLISTDPKSPRVTTVLSKGDLNVSKVFNDAVTGFGIQGSGNEQGIRQAVNGLKSPPPGGAAGTTWLRNKSSVAVLIISDEDNCSDGRDCGSEPWATPSYLLNHLGQIRSIGQDARVYAIHHIPGTICSTGENQGKQYEVAVKESLGRSGSICDTSYATTLREISANVRSTLKNQFQLAHEPAAGSVKVFVNNAQTAAFTLNGAVIEFPESAKPPAGATIRVEYETKPSSTYFKSLTLTDAADPETISVQVAERILDKSEYTYRRDDRLLSFAAAPADGARVLVRYKVGELLTVFPLGNSTGLQEGSLKITNAAGEPVTNWVRSEAGVVFDTPPAEGSVYKARAVRTKGAQTKYSFNFGSGSFLNVVTASDQPLEAERQGDFVVFQPGSVVAGREVTVRLRSAIEGSTFALEPNVVTSSITVNVSGDSCTAFSYAGDSLTLDPAQCPLSTSAEVVVNYQVEIK